MAAGERPCLGWLQVMAFHADSLSAQGLRAWTEGLPARSPPPWLAVREAPFPHGQNLVR